jgi:hypothetical protein
VAPAPLDADAQDLCAATSVALPVIRQGGHYVEDQEGGNGQRDKDDSFDHGSSPALVELSVKARCLLVVSVEASG